MEILGILGISTLILILAAILVFWISIQSFRYAMSATGAHWLLIWILLVLTLAGWVVLFFLAIAQTMTDLTKLIGKFLR